jgi:hypothetical protein
VDLRLTICDRRYGHVGLYRAAGMHLILHASISLIFDSG